MLNEPEVLELFGSQFGVATFWQLADLGVTRRRFDRALGAQLCNRVAPGIVRLVGWPDSFESRCQVLNLHGGHESYITGFAGGRLWGLRKMPLPSIEFSVAQATRIKAPAWATLRRSSWIDPELDAHKRGDGLVVASPLRCLFQLASMCSDAQFVRACEDAWMLAIASPAEAAQYIEAIRRKGRSGVKRFVAWLDDVSGRPQPTASQSGLETDLAAMVTEQGLPAPIRQYPLVLESGITVHLDLAWPDVQLALEPGHRWWHGGDERVRRDQERDVACARRGWQVLRFDDVELRHPDNAARQIVAVYRSRSAMMRQRPDNQCGFSTAEVEKQDQFG